MPRIRTIKPELWQSPEVMNLSHSARLLFIGLISQADDEGRGSADLRKLRSAIFGGDDLTPAQVRAWLAELAEQRLAVLYSVDGFGDLYWLPSWDEHQYVPKPTPSKYPFPEKSTVPDRYQGKLSTGCPQTDQKTLPERYRNATGTVPGDRKDRKDRIGKDRNAHAREPGAPPGLDAGRADARRGPEDAKVAQAQAEARRKAIEDNRRTMERISAGTVQRVPT